MNAPPIATTSRTVRVELGTRTIFNILGPLSNPANVRLHLIGVFSKTLLEPLERMRGFPGVSWHVISGNHDFHRGNGLWDRARALGLPSNVHLHLAPEAAPLGDGAVLLPAPLKPKGHK